MPMSEPVALPRPPLRRRLLRSVMWIGGCYLGVIIVLLLLENALVYHPCPASADWLSPPTGSEPADVWVQTPDGRIHGWWFERPGATGALLYSHGNAGNLSHRGSGAV